MLSFFVVFLIAINVESQSVCIWGKQGINSMINGLYTAGSGTYNSYIYYTKSIPASCQSYNFPTTLYLFRGNNDWRIGSALNISAGYNAYCSSTQATPTIDCGKENWLAADNGFVSVPTVFAQADSCPTWNCHSVTTTISGSCAGPFTNNEGANAWSNSGQTSFFFYHQIYATWYCSSSINQGCDAIFTASGGIGWMDLTTGQNTTFTFTVAASPSPTQAEYTVECKDSGGGNTNPAPTNSPMVSNNNNPSPTGSPNSSGNPSPTTSPVTNGNNNPSPTSSPTPSTDNGNPGGDANDSGAFKRIPTCSILVVLIFLVLKL